jgi:hypothetical protein
MKLSNTNLINGMSLIVFAFTITSIASRIEAALPDTASSTSTQQPCVTVLTRDAATGGKNFDFYNSCAWPVRVSWQLTNNSVANQLLPAGAFATPKIVPKDMKSVASCQTNEVFDFANRQCRQNVSESASDLVINAVWPTTTEWQAIMRKWKSLEAAESQSDRLIASGLDKVQLDCWVQISTMGQISDSRCDDQNYATMSTATAKWFKGRDAKPVLVNGTVQESWVLAPAVVWISPLFPCRKDSRFDLPEGAKMVRPEYAAC